MMSLPSWVDSRLVIWFAGLCALGVLSYARLEALAADVARVQQTLDQQESSLAEHVASDGHSTRGMKVAALETDQAKIERQIERIETRQQKMDRNMAVLCDKLGARCE